jgi:hypothetical protein
MLKLDRIIFLIPAYWFVSIAILMGSVELVRLVTTPSPVYASDEYAYLQQSRLVGADSSFAARDPYIQAIGNRLYFKILSLVRWFSSDITGGVRALNFLGYYGLLGIGGFFWFRFRGLKRGAGLFSLLICIQAFSVYALSLMPEVTYAVMFTVGAWVLVTQIGAKPIRAITTSAVVFVSLLYVKPHAVAIIVAFLVFVPVEGLLRRDTFLRLLGKTALAFGVVLLSVMAFNTWLFQDLSLKPHFIGEVYSNITSGGLQFWMSTDHLRQAAGLAITHGLGIVILFPTLVLLQVWGKGGMLQRGNRSTVLQPLALFAALSLTVVLAMVIKFSVEVGSINAGENARLFGRYVGFLFPLLAWLVAEWSESARTTAPRYLVILVYALAAGGFVLCLRGLRLFPWDYADLFLFFDGTNHYWPFPQLEWIRPTVICIIVLLLLLGVTARISVSVMLLSIGMVVSVGSLVRVTYWQENHARLHKKYSDAGRALRLMHPEMDDRLMIFGTERFGLMSYVLYGYDGFPWVRQIIEGESSRDLPSQVSLAAGVGPVESPFESPILQSIGPVTVFAKDGGAMGGFVASTTILKAGETMKIPFQSPRPGAMVSGFNESEPWGAWTSKPVARVILNRKILGHVRINGSAWVASLSSPSFTLKLGKTLLQVPTSVTPQPFSVECNLDTPVDEIQIHYPVTRAQSESRPLGVALTQLEIISS